MFGVWTIWGRISKCMRKTLHCIIFLRQKQECIFCLRWGESLTINLKTVDTPVLTMCHIIIFNVVTPYMHFTIHNPSHFLQKKYKQHVWKKKWFAMKITIVICIGWYWHSWFDTNFSQKTCAFFLKTFFHDVLEGWKL